MKTAIFSILFLSSISVVFSDTALTDVEGITNFIKQHSKPKKNLKVFPQPPFPKTEGAKVTRLANNLLQLDYVTFTVWLDCQKKGAVKFRYIAQKDSGHLKRHKKYHQDSSIPKMCQQKSFRGYGKGYDRGHLVPANHLDHSRAAIVQSNFMTNILPQASEMNRGAWLRTEEIVECYRDVDELLVIGGVIWGNNQEDDHFVESHGVRTPDAFWKVIIRGKGQDQRAIAWVIPNSKDAKRRKLDGYLVSITELERVTNENIPVADYAKHDKPYQSWLIPRGCEKG